MRERVAIVAGASGGIGRVTTRAFVAAGARVVAAATDDALLAALRDEFAPLPDRVLVVPVDITSADEVAALAARALVAFGRIDVLANVAGISTSPALADCRPDEIARVVAVNLTGAALLSHAVLPAMKAQRSGAIVHVGSVAGEAGIMGIYSASKFGLRGLCDTLRREVRADGISVSLIEPGFVATPMNGAMTNLPGPQIVADAIVQAVDRPRRVRIVPSWYRFAVALVKAFPAAADLVFGNAAIQRRLNRDARDARAARP